MSPVPVAVLRAVRHAAEAGGHPSGELHVGAEDAGVDHVDGDPEPRGGVLEHLIQREVPLVDTVQVPRDTGPGLHPNDVRGRVGFHGSDVRVVLQGPHGAALEAALHEAVQGLIPHDARGAAETVEQVMLLGGGHVGLEGDDVAVRRRGLRSRLPQGGDPAEQEGDEGPWMGRHKETAEKK
jgi:hypothetical protein